jgi:hypothetical protein
MLTRGRTILENRQTSVNGFNECLREVKKYFIFYLFLFLT